MKLHANYCSERKDPAPCIYVCEQSVVSTYVEAYRLCIYVRMYIRNCGCRILMQMWRPTSPTHSLSVDIRAPPQTGTCTWHHNPCKQALYSCCCLSHSLCVIGNVHAWNHFLIAHTDGVQIKLTVQSWSVR